MKRDFFNRTSPRRDRPIIDPQGRVLSVLVPPPEDPLYQASSTRVFDKMMAEGKAANFSPGELSHKRGKGFAAINAGLSYGNGHKKPTQLKHGAREVLVSNLLEDPNLQRLAAYQGG